MQHEESDGLLPRAYGTKPRLWMEVRLGDRLRVGGDERPLRCGDVERENGREVLGCDLAQSDSRICGVGCRVCLPLDRAAQRMAAKLRPRVMLPRRVSSTATRAAEARGRQLQRLVGRRSARVAAGS